LSDLRERLAAAAHEGWRKQYQSSGRHDKDYLDVPYDQLTEEWKDYDRATFDASIPIIESELAQATADTLAQAAAAARKFVHRAYRSESNSSIVEQGIESCILSLRPDIAAKAKEHDANIRRDAYLRCAWFCHDKPEIEKVFRKWANEADGGGK
jgi:hypothetical protein